jgi:hypothetical protein
MIRGDMGQTTQPIKTFLTKQYNQRKPMMHTQTHSLTNRWLSLLTAFLALLLLFIMTGANASAQALPTTTDSAHTSTVLLVDRTDDTAEAQACTDAPDDCSLRGAIIKANQQVSSTIFFQSVANPYQLTIAPGRMAMAAPSPIKQPPIRQGAIKQLRPR